MGIADFLKKRVRIREFVLVQMKYARYVLIHRWFVFVQCVRLGIPIRGLLHDLSKFRPDEWFAYARWYNGTWGFRFNGGFYSRVLHLYQNKLPWEFVRHGEWKAALDRAWLRHQHRNPHHWQYWVLVGDDVPVQVLEMPLKYRKEMLADWRGAGRAKKGFDNTPEWYMSNREKIVLGPETRQWIEEAIGLSANESVERAGVSNE